MKKNEKDLLFSTDVKLSEKEYKEMTKIMPIFNASFVPLFIKIILILIPFILLSKENLTEYMPSILVYSLVVSLIVHFASKKNEYQDLVKGGIIDNEYKVIFYKDYLTKEGKVVSLGIKYTDIIKSMETDDSFYLFYRKGAAIVINKKSCDEKLIAFIREISNETNNNDKIDEKESTVEKKFEEVKSKTTKAKLLKTLFIINILMFFLSQYILSPIFDKSVPVIYTRYMWMYSFFLPLPILSLILGIIYKNKGIKCTKNIVIGIIGILFFLSLASSANTFDSNYKKDYQESFKFQDILGSNLPEDGTFYQITWEKSEFDNQISNFILFDDDNFQTFLNNIKDSDNWNLKDNINDSNLKYYIPKILECSSTSNKCYYSIYVKETKQYNTVPTEKASYRMYSMMYDVNKKYLQIDEYNINI